MFVINYLQQTFNNLSYIAKLKKNGHANRIANQLTEGTNRTTGSNKARRRLGNRYHELRKGDTEREVNGCGKEEGNRSTLQDNKELLQHRRTCSQTRSKERSISFFPLFLFSDYRTLTLLQALDDFCLQINPLLLGALIR